MKGGSAADLVMSGKYACSIVQVEVEAFAQFFEEGILLHHAFVLFALAEEFFLDALLFFERDFQLEAHIAQFRAEELHELGLHFIHVFLLDDVYNCKADLLVLKFGHGCAQGRIATGRTVCLPFHKSLPCGFEGFGAHGFSGTVEALGLGLFIRPILFRLGGIQFVFEAVGSGRTGILFQGTGRLGNGFWCGANDG